MAHLPAHTVEFGLADRAVTIPVHPVKSPVVPIPERKFITAQHTVAVAIGARHHTPGVRFCLFHRLIFQFLETERSVPIGIRPCDMVLTTLRHLITRNLPIGIAVKGLEGHPRTVIHWFGQSGAHRQRYGTNRHGKGKYRFFFIFTTPDVLTLARYPLRCVTPLQTQTAQFSVALILSLFRDIPTQRPDATFQSRARRRR